MNIKKAVAQRLLANTALTATIKAEIYRGNLPENIDIKPPHIIIDRIGNDRHYNHDGYSGLTEAELQIACYSRDPDEADLMAEIVTASLESWPAESADIDDIFISNISDGFEQQTQVQGVFITCKISFH